METHKLTPIDMVAQRHNPISSGAVAQINCGMRFQKMNLITKPESIGEILKEHKTKTK